MAVQTGRPPLSQCGLSDPRAHASNAQDRRGHHSAAADRADLPYSVHSRTGNPHHFRCSRPLPIFRSTRRCTGKSARRLVRASVAASHGSLPSAVCHRSGEERFGQTASIHPSGATRLKACRHAQGVIVIVATMILAVTAEAQPASARLTSDFTLGSPRTPMDVAAYPCRDRATARRRPGSLKHASSTQGEVRFVLRETRSHNKVVDAAVFAIARCSGSAGHCLAC